MTIYPTLREAVKARMVEWDGKATIPISISFYGNELAGEVGEACNIIKKLDRERMGLPGSRATAKDLADELADAMICIRRLEARFGFDLDAATARKFNETSAKIGLETRVAE